MNAFRRISCIFLSILMVLALPVQALAAEVGDYNLTLTETGGDPTPDVDYSYAAPAESSTSGTLNIISNTAMTVTNNSSAPVANDNIVISASDANVTFDNVAIDTSTSGGAAVTVAPDASANITLEGDNTVKSGSGHAGVEVAEGASATISEGKDGGSLTATGGKNSVGEEGGAGIGGGYNQNGGTINIEGGTIVANGGGDAAGIGGGTYGGAGNIEITGGNVKAEGSGTFDITFGPNFRPVTTPTAGGAGIGSGSDAQGTVGSISISGSDTVVVATGGGAGSGIGNGMNSSGVDVVITGGDVYANNKFGDGIDEESAEISGNGTVTDNGVLIYPDPSNPTAPQPTPQPDPSLTVSEPKKTNTVDFWSSVNWKISQAEEGSTLTVDAGNYTYIPRYVIENAVRCNVTLFIKWNGGNDFTIKPTDEIDLSASTIPMKDLA